MTRGGSTSNETPATSFGLMYGVDSCLLALSEVRATTVVGIEVVSHG
jgi:hypothetical protein